VDTWEPGWPRPEVSGEPVTIAGQLCTPKDVLARDVPAGRLRVGDVVAFGLAGAYAWNISHHEFLMHPPPAIRYLNG
jgi:diaminopimelate decarboxylase